jgi:hypothetical protein
MTVGELCRRMSASEFHEWNEFDKFHPFGDERADDRMGVLASVMANIYRPKNRAAFKPRDFALKYEDEKPRVLTPEQSLAVAKAFVHQTGGTIIERDRSGE